MSKFSPVSTKVRQMDTKTLKKKMAKSSHAIRKEHQDSADALRKEMKEVERQWKRDFEKS